MFDMEPENSTFVKGTPVKRRRNVSARGLGENYQPRINIQRERTIGGILPFGRCIWNANTVVHLHKKGGGRGGDEREGIRRTCFCRRKNSARR